MDTGAGIVRHARHLAVPELSRETAADVALAALPTPPRHRADPRPAAEVRAPVFDPIPFEARLASVAPVALRAENAADFDWPASAALDLWALTTRLEAACRRGESRQGWVPCRVIRQAIRSVD